MKITRRQLRRLISETIYVNPQGDAYDNRRMDITKPYVKAEHERQAKIEFLKSQSDERLRKFAPDDLDIEDDSHDPFLNQGVELANLVGDQGEFQGNIEFTDDELELKQFVDKEFNDMMASGFDPEHTIMQGGGRPQVDYSEQIDRIEHQMKLRAMKVLKQFKHARYWDLIDTIQEVPSYEKLMRIVSEKEGDFSPTMKTLMSLPDRVVYELTGIVR